MIALSPVLNDVVAFFFSASWRKDGNSTRRGLETCVFPFFNRVFLRPTRSLLRREKHTVLVLVSRGGGHPNELFGREIAIIQYMVRGIRYLPIFPPKHRCECLAGKREVVHALTRRVEIAFYFTIFSRGLGRTRKTQGKRTRRTTRWLRRTHVNGEWKGKSAPQQKSMHGFLNSHKF